MYLKSALFSAALKVRLNSCWSLLRMDNFDYTKMNAHFQNFAAFLREGVIHEWKQALLPPYVAKQLTAQIHTQSPFSCFGYCCIVPSVPLVDLFNGLLWAGRNGLPPTPDTLHLGCSYHLHSSHRFLSTLGVGFSRCVTLIWYLGLGAGLKISACASRFALATPSPSDMPAWYPPWLDHGQLSLKYLNSVTELLGDSVAQLVRGWQAICQVVGSSPSLSHCHFLYFYFYFFLSH